MQIHEILRKRCLRFNFESWTDVTRRKQGLKSCFVCFSPINYISFECLLPFLLNSFNIRRRTSDRTASSDGRTLSGIGTLFLPYFCSLFSSFFFSASFSCQLTTLAFLFLSLEWVTVILLFRLIKTCSWYYLICFHFHFASCSKILLYT